ncbi:hemerythrin domain-containing protein [Acetobacterium bakii]|uniref:Hemerythrin-like domain-containing protein n=1 Tax=Acetobacterium bakii TaxID=52689 RepID=A0A0L6TZ16_9FIRM|nr:hemerythrin domain-containing protein [Acetobacterium bakii]KNZ41322.1 hypothetical protein AKG39_12620 [Acetobacterium bakii]
MDIFKEIKKEHDEFKKIAEKISPTSERAIKTRTDSFAKLKLELTAHHEAEEEVLVPVLKENKATRQMGIEIVEEHNILKKLMEELESLSVDDETWIVKFKVFNEIMEKHTDEEEHEISKKTHEEFEQKRLDELGDLFEAEDKKIEKQLKQKKQE